jgi:hypothetical protein
MLKIHFYVFFGEINNALSENFLVFDWIFFGYTGAILIEMLLCKTTT